MLTDESLMPFGLHKGKTMATVPEEYLLWLYNEKRCFGEVLQYIEENLDVIQEQIKYKNKCKN